MMTYASDGCTVLQYACDNGNASFHVISKLLEASERELIMTDRDGFTVLHNGYFAPHLDNSPNFNGAFTLLIKEHFLAKIGGENVLRLPHHTTTLREWISMSDSRTQSMMNTINQLQHHQSVSSLVSPNTQIISQNNQIMGMLSKQHP